MSIAGARPMARVGRLNIGFVLYRKGSEPGTLEADWCHLRSGAGTGRAVGGPLKGFAGRYTIRYFDSEGNLDDTLELVISQRHQLYEVSWCKDGVVTCIGIGMQVNEGLAVGWRAVNDQGTDE